MTKPDPDLNPIDNLWEIIGEKVIEVYIGVIISLPVSE